MSTAPLLGERTLLKIGAYAPVVYAAVFGVGWLVLSHFFPPFSPAGSPEQIADQFMDRRLAILLGSVVMMMSTLILMPYGALLTLVVRKAEGGFGMLTLMMAFSQVTYLVMSFFVPFFLAVATFRSGRSDELVQLAGDLSFLQFMGGIPMFLMTWIIIAVASLAAPRDRAVIPRWFGYVSLWCAILYLPELLVFFFTTGPFAWDGLVGFWIPAVLFAIYYNAATFAFLGIVRRENLRD